ncbi:MAG: hypothetical protein ACOCY6_05370 [Halodesulfurarchaeum sp.]
MDYVDDRLDAVAIPIGLFVLIVGLGTLLGQPWQYAAGGVATMVLQLFGAIAAIAIGVGLLALVVRFSR